MTPSVELNTSLPSQKVTDRMEKKIQLVKLTIENIKKHLEMLPVWHTLAITGPIPQAQDRSDDHP